LFAEHTADSDADSSAGAVISDEPSGEELGSDDTESSEHDDYEEVEGIDCSFFFGAVAAIST